MEREAVLAFRLTGQRLTAPAATLLEVAGGWGLQDSPPGSALLAAHVRTAGTVDEGTLGRALLEDRTLVELYNARTATAVVPAAEAGAYGAAQLPPDEAELRAVLGRAVPPDGTGPHEAVERTGEVVLEALDGRVLSRDELHEHLRRRLPEDLLPWCPGCRSHHARRGLLVAACLRGELCLAGSAGRQPAFARPDQWLPAVPARPDPGEALADLARRYLRAHGPSTPAHLAAWGGFPRTHAARAFDLLGEELTAVPGHGQVLGSDAGRLQDAPRHAGLVLLPPGDPLLLGRDRELLVPDAERRKALWRAVTPPGAVLADGEVAGTWRARRRATTLEVTADPWTALDHDRLHAAATALAGLRGARTATVAIA